MRTHHRRTAPFAALLLALCLSQTGCVGGVHGAPYNASQQCWEAEESFAYVGDLGCDDAISYVMDGDGSWWRFPNSCVPRRFDEPKGNAPLELMLAPECD